MELRDLDYYGNVYTGAGFVENVMIFDTMSQYTVLNTEETNGSLQPSYYEPFRSVTARQVKSGKNQEDSFKSLDFGENLQFQGYVYKDDMCLY